MRIHTFAVGLLTATLATQVRPTQVWAVDIPTPANAADTYRQAFTLLDRTSAAQSAPLQDDVKTTPLGDEVTKLLADNAEALTLLQRAATEPACTWGETSDVAKVMPDLNKARTASRLLVLRTRANLQSNHPDAADDDLIAQFALARRTGQMNLLVARLVSAAIESQALDQATTILPSLPEPSRKHFTDSYAKLPKPPTGHDMILGEYAYAKQAIVKQGLSKDWVTILEPFYKNIAAAADGPTDKFDATVDAELPKVKLNPFAQTLAPSLKRAHANLAKVDTQRTAFESSLQKGA